MKTTLPTEATIYTIGYATKSLSTFIQQLKDHSIDVIADVRSVPYSKVFHDYHQENIKAQLSKQAIRYVYLGDELGPRSKDPLHYDETGQVQFDLLMKSALFSQDVERLAVGLNKGLSIALMCAEKDPATCHRSLLIGYFLQRNSECRILHIDHNGAIETKNTLECRLCDIHKLGDDLFMSPEEQQEQAYKIHLKHTSYIKS